MHAICRHAVIFARDVTTLCHGLSHAHTSTTQDAIRAAACGARCVDEDAGKSDINARSLRAAADNPAARRESAQRTLKTAAQSERARGVLSRDMQRTFTMRCAPDPQKDPFAASSDPRARKTL